jgi:geranylgeranyl diphosphate synthase type I
MVMLRVRSSGGCRRAGGWGGGAGEGVVTRSQAAEVDFGDWVGAEGVGWVGEGVREVLAGFFAARRDDAAIEFMPDELVVVLRDFLLSGGKRLRPALCAVGWLAAGGIGDRRSVLRVSASLEMFHAFALIHDDIMDGSDRRRGRPAVHCALAERYSLENRPAAARLGVSVAILVGDLALTWADELVHTAGLSAEQLSGVLAALDVMRTELMFGQYLDLMSTGRPSEDVDHAIKIARYKTAKYSVEWPLRIGATLAGADEAVMAALREYSLPLGEAFQLRDDLLDVYGRSDATGKPLFDDVRQGKHTALIALALQRADRVDAAMLRACLGDPALTDIDAGRVCDVVTALGARAAVEELIADRRAQALRVLDTAPFPPTASALLREFAVTATVRVG